MRLNVLTQTRRVSIMRITAQGLSEECACGHSPVSRARGVCQISLPINSPPASFVSSTQRRVTAAHNKTCPLCVLTENLDFSHTPRQPLVTSRQTCVDVRIKKKEAPERRRENRGTEGRMSGAFFGFGRLVLSRHPSTSFEMCQRKYRSNKNRQSKSKRARVPFRTRRP